MASATTVSGNGITGGNFDAYGSNRTIPRAMTAFTAIAWYNSIEILVLSLFVFQRYRGLYFWSVIVAALAIGLYAAGAWMYQNNVNLPKSASDALMTIGWVIMIPSQSLVLWSRLHLVTQNTKFLRFLLILIITDSVLCISATIVFNWGAFEAKTPFFLRGYSIMEKIEMCVFTAQEVFISLVYLWEVRKMMQVICEAKSRAVMRQLVAMNVFIIALDMSLLGIEFCNLFMIQVTMKSMVYSVKLKVEFAVLSSLISLVRGKTRAKSATPGDAEKAAAQLASHFATWGSDSTGVSRFMTLDGSQRYPESAMLFDEGEGRYLRNLQQNVPPDWRLSIGHEAIGGPNLLEMKEEWLAVGEGDSISSVEKMYPGRLG